MWPGWSLVSRFVVRISLAGTVSGKVTFLSTFEAEVSTLLTKAIVIAATLGAGDHG